jgi:hypothetical protein
MATWYLMNNVHVGTVRRYAGTLIDDAQIDITQIQAVGGKLEPSTRTGLAAASVIALAYVRKGNHKLAESVMNAALDNTQSGFTVDSTSPSDLSYQTADSYPALSAAGTNYVAQYAAGAALDDAVGPFVSPTYPFRTAQIVLGVGGAVSVDFTIDGIDAFGNVVSEVINAAGAGTYQGEIAYSEITRFRSDIDPSGTTDLQVGDGFALSNPIDGALGVNHLAADEILEVPVSVDPDSGTVVPLTPPDGSVNFHIHYDSYIAIPVHTHTITF